MEEEEAQKEAKKDDETETKKGKEPQTRMDGEKNDIEMKNFEPNEEIKSELEKVGEENHKDKTEVEMKGEDEQVEPEDKDENDPDISPSKFQLLEKGSFILKCIYNLLIIKMSVLISQPSSN